MNRFFKFPHNSNAGVLAIVFGIGVFGYLLNTTQWLTMIPGDLGDPRFNSVILEHLYQWTTDATQRLWHPQFFYPFEWVLGFSDNHFGSAWSYVALRLLGLAREEAYLGWFLCGSVLSFWGCWFALTKLEFSSLGAALGAFVFAFGLPVLHQESHAQLVYRFAIPLAVLAWYRVLTVRDTSSLIQTIFWCSLQFLCSIYLGIFLAYLLLAMLIAYWACTLLPVVLNDSKITEKKPKNEVSRRWWGHRWFASWSLTTVVYVLCVVGVLMLALVMLRRYELVFYLYSFERPLDVVASMLPRLGSYLLADHSELSGWIGRGLTHIPARVEQQMFVGVGVCCIALIGAILTLQSRNSEGLNLEIRQLVRLSILALLFLVICTLFVFEGSLYLMLAESVPGIRAVRVVSRIILVMMMPVAVLVAAGVDALVKFFGLRLHPLLLASLLVMFVTTESVYYQPDHTLIQSWRDRRDQLAGRIGSVLEKDAILFVTSPPGQDFFMAEIDAMIYAQDHKHPTFNGYSGNYPPGYTYLNPCTRAQNRINGYLDFVAARGRNPPHDGQSLLQRLHVVELGPCIDPNLYSADGLPKGPQKK